MSFYNNKSSCVLLQFLRCHCVLADGAVSGRVEILLELRRRIPAGGEEIWNPITAYSDHIPYLFPPFCVLSTCHQLVVCCGIIVWLEINKKDFTIVLTTSFCVCVCKAY